MLTYTTCRACKGPLLVTDVDNPDNWHPTCPPSPTPIERMTEEYLTAIAKGDRHAEAHLESKLWDIQLPPPRLHAAARMYATTYGWPVFPLKELGKAPATKNGFKDATTDLTKIDEWWYQNPNFNIGIPTGVYFDVIDVDPPRGWESWHSIQKVVLPDVHGRVVTQSMGAHFYVYPTGGGNRAGIYPGIDYRGVGGYVVAPPSWLGEQRFSWSWGIYPSPFITPTLKGIVDEWQAMHA